MEKNIFIYLNNACTIFFYGRTHDYVLDLKGLIYPKIYLKNLLTFPFFYDIMTLQERDKPHKKKGKKIMQVKDKVFITKRATEELEFEYDDKVFHISTSAKDYPYWRSVYDTLVRKCGNTREGAFNTIESSPDFKQRIEDFLKIANTSAPTEEKAPEIPLNVRLTTALRKLIDFFKEFEFEPNFRFVNTLAYKVKDSVEDAKDFIRNYFALVDNQYKTEVANKIESREFNGILSELGVSAPNDHINKRFKVYYGSAGTGKTTLAMKESDNRCVVCNASMLPADLMEDFVFANGQPTFQKSSLWNCMENGLPIVLDEINLLPFDSLRFLQGILDGKKEFDYKGHKVTIKDGFEVIGTMNLTIGGMVYGLPEPLIDRCSDMKKFVLSAEQLLNAVM